MYRLATTTESDFVSEVRERELARRGQRGSALIGALIVTMALLGLVYASVSMSSVEVLDARRAVNEVRARQVASAGMERGLNFMSTAAENAGMQNPITMLADLFAGGATITPYIGEPLMNGAQQVGAYTVSITLVSQTNSEVNILVRSTGYLPDAPNDGGRVEAWHAIEATVRYALAPSEVFDYGYFINNWGWFYGNTIACRGNIRSNGQFDAAGYAPYAGGQPIYDSVSTSGGSTTLTGYHDDNGDGLTDGNDGGIFNRNETTGAISVDIPFLGNSPLQSYGLDIGWSDGGFMVSGTQDNGTLRTLSIARETSNGVVANWEHTYGGDGPDDISIHPTNPDVVYANSWVGPGNFPRWRITARATNFTETSNGMPMIWMNPITMNKLNTNQAFTADTAWLYYHDPTANRWRRATTAPRDYSIATDGSARRIAMNVGTSASVTAYVTFWTTASTVKIYEGTPGSMTRRTVQMPGREPVHTVVADRWDASTAYAFTGFNPGQPSKIYRTTDRGVRWDSIDGDLPETINYWDLERNPSNPNILYVSSDIGVFKTRNGGATWYPLQQGLPVVG